MSFIYDDKDLLDKFLKSAQVAPQQSTLSMEVYNKALQLLQNIDGQLRGDTIITSSRDNADLNLKHLQNLEALLNFLAFNEIKINSLQIVISANRTEKPEDELKKLGYFPYPNQTNEPIQYWVSKDGLISYLKTLQGKNNPVLNTMLGERINEANSKLGISMPTKPEAKPGETKPGESEVKPGEAKPGDVKPGEKPADQSERDRNKSQTTDLNKLMMEDLPLIGGAVSLDKIAEFLKKYSALGNIISVDPYHYAQAGDMWGKLKSKVTIQTIPLVKDSHALDALPLIPAPNNEVKNIEEFLNLLGKLVDSVGNLLLGIKSNYSAMLSPESNNKLGQQIGYGSETRGPGSFWASNIDDIEYLKRENKKPVKV